MGEESHLTCWIGGVVRWDVRVVVSDSRGTTKLWHQDMVIGVDGTLHLEEHLDPTSRSDDESNARLPCMAESLHLERKHTQQQEGLTRCASFVVVCFTDCVSLDAWRWCDSLGKGNRTTLGIGMNISSVWPSRTAYIIVLRKRTWSKGSWEHLMGVLQEDLRLAAMVAKGNESSWQERKHTNLCCLLSGTGVKWYATQGATWHLQTVWCWRVVNYTHTHIYTCTHTHTYTLTHIHTNTYMHT